LASVALVLLTADVAMGGLATYADEEVVSALGTNGGDVYAGVSGLGEIGLSGGVLIVTVLVTTHASWRAWPLMVSVGTVGSGLLLVLALKALTSRPSPGDVDVPGGYPGFFPSGHTATAGLCLGTACFVLMTWRRYTVRGYSPSAVGTLVGLAVAVLVGTASVLGGYHWVSDALGSVLITAMVLPLGFAGCRLSTNRSTTARHNRAERG
jgi:undecaprenyl-diphosphatase